MLLTGLGNMKKLNKRFGFTLSEVMIALTSIGVVASLTISTIGASVQQRARLAEFRSAHAKAELALRSLVFDEGRIYQCYICPSTATKTLYGLDNTMAGTCSGGTSATACQELTTAFLRSMGKVRSCETNPKTEGCIPNNYKNAAGTCFTNLENTQAYVLDNGMIIFTENKNSGIKTFAIDVNGRKGPNKWGQDIFTFSVFASATSKTGSKTYVTDIKLLPPETCLPTDGGRASKDSKQMMKESTNFE